MEHCDVHRAAATSSAKWRNTCIEARTLKCVPSGRAARRHKLGIALKHLAQLDNSVCVTKAPYPKFGPTSH